MADHVYVAEPFFSVLINRVVLSSLSENHSVKRFCTSRVNAIRCPV